MVLTLYKARAAEVVRRAGGIPFFLISWVREVERTDSGEPTTPVLPWDLRRSIQRRVTAPREAARPLLAAVAVIGCVTTLPLLAAVLEWTEREVLDVLESACRAGLPEEVGEDAYGFVHDVIREVVEGNLGLVRALRVEARVLLSQGHWTEAVR